MNTVDVRALKLIWGDIVRALAEVNLVTAAQVKQKLPDDHTGARRSIDRYWKERGRWTKPDGRTRQNLLAIAKLTSRFEELSRRIDDVFHVERPAAAFATSYRSSSFGDTHWFAVVPEQPGRPSATLDVVIIDDPVDMEPKESVIEGRIVRVFPPSDRPYSWRFYGSHFGNEYYALAFWPINADYTSRGVICLHPVQRLSDKTATFEGFYYRMSHDLKIDPEDVFPRLNYEWTQRAPQALLPRVALLDLDNTLRPGWSIKPWVEFLVEEQIRGAARCATAVDEYLASFAAGAITHDELAVNCGIAYAALMKGKRKAEMAEAADNYARDYERVFAFAEPLMHLLESFLIAPVIVSGAPGEIVREAASRLGVERYMALDLETDARGVYTGAIRDNPGTTEAKRDVVARIRQEGHTIELGMGDSTSDLPLLQAARNRILVGNQIADRKAWNQHFLRIDPPTSDAAPERIGEITAEILGWLRQHVNSPEFFFQA